jgi:hypothetical protein
MMKISPTNLARRYAQRVGSARLRFADIHAAPAGVPESLVVDLGAVKSRSCLELALAEAFQTIGHEIRRKD